MIEKHHRLVNGQSSLEKNDVAAPEQASGKSGQQDSLTTSLAKLRESAAAGTDRSKLLRQTRGAPKGFEALAAALLRILENSRRITLGEAIRAAQNLGLGGADALAAVERLARQQPAGLQRFYVDRSGGNARIVSADEVLAISAGTPGSLSTSDVEVVWAANEAEAIAAGAQYRLAEVMRKRERGGDKAGPGAQYRLAEIIRKLERDGDEHGVAEELHAVGEALARLIETAHRAEVSFNTVRGCYERNPANFAAALRELEQDVLPLRAALASTEGADADEPAAEHDATPACRQGSVAELIESDRALDAAEVALALARKDLGQWSQKHLGYGHPAVVAVREAKARRAAALACVGDLL